MKRWLPWLIVSVCAGAVLLSLRTAPETGFHTREFGRLPALLNGRIQPLDSVARNSLLQIRGKQSVFLENTNKSGTFPQGESLSAIQWLMGVMMKPEVANEQKVFRIDNPELLALLKLPDNQKYFSFNQLALNYDEVRRQSMRVETEKQEPQTRTAFEKQAVKLFDSMMLYQRLAVTIRPLDSENLAQELAQVQKDIAALRAGSETQASQPEAVELAQFLSRFRLMADYSTVLIIPPNPGESRDAWKTMGASLTNALREDQMNAGALHYAGMVTAYRANQPAEFNAALEKYHSYLEQRFTPELAKGGNEFFFNSFAPFYKALLIYVLAFVLACASWFNLSQWLRRSALYLVVLAWCIHTFGMVFRMVLEGRPPVTNLYSSAVFIGWGAAILGMALEKIYRDGIGSAIAATAGFLALIIAHNLALGGDTMEMLRAVLDTNFWLATHVTVVTLGYSATFVAGFLAIIYILRGVFTRTLGNEESKRLARMVYGIVCFATLFSFAGTILGGIWADQSWGRFWGWDPKENGALLIVIWNAIILHARWGGMIKERGLMLMAIFGNIVTGWSWFGVNMLGIGLHSYGFTDQAFWWLLAFAVSQLVLIGLGLLPKQYWRSLPVTKAPLVLHPSKTKPTAVSAPA
ncbi:MAG TPA: cytochrome c biogenesis protein CcsA [Verrucomicrobiae bacterium]|nr:cytochrome c biogenesis protein CcsA [Verrucomicrobiae bacterium]